MQNEENSWKEARAFAQKIRGQGGKVVFTNGCFDLMHPGHVLYLREARELGDALIVGLNSDTSVRQLKGPQRPILDEKARSIVLQGLSAVDLTCIFNEETPLNLIRAIQPDILVKGGDYAIADIVGADFVQEKGGQVRVLSFVEGYSTSKIVEKIRQ